jgi:hypothetical protein
MGGRQRRADREDSVRRTVYVSDIDQHVRISYTMNYSIWGTLPSFLFLDLLRSLSLQVTEQKLAEVFSTCGQVRIYDLSLSVSRTKLLIAIFTLSLSRVAASYKYVILIGRSPPSLECWYACIRIFCYYEL